MRFFAALSLLPLALAAQKHPITHEDVWQMKRVGAPAVSPDGKWAVVSVTEPSYDSAKTVSDLWMAPLDGSAPPRRITSTRAPEDAAVFSPDSTRLAFTTRREGDDHPQVYILPLQGGEAVRVTQAATGAVDPHERHGEFLEPSAANDLRHVHLRDAVSTCSITWTSRHFDSTIAGMITQSGSDCPCEL